MSIFSTQEQISALTGCRSFEAQLDWLKRNKIEARVNHGGEIVVVRRLVEEMMPRTRPDREDRFDSLLNLRAARSKHSFDRRSTGIYLLKKGQTIVYVGQTTNFLSRAANHVANPEYDFDTIDFVPIPKSQLNLYERELIARLCPKHNIVHNTFAKPFSRAPREHA